MGIAIIAYFKALAEEFEDPIPRAFEEWFHRPPALLKRALVANLLTIWCSVRQEKVGKLKIGGATYEKGVLGFLSASLSAFDDPDGSPLIPLSTLRRYATELRAEAREDGEKILGAYAQIVSSEKTI